MGNLLSSIYGLVTQIRNRLFDSGIFQAYESSIPVISVGNLTAGGNGKTPLVIFLAQKLRARGYTPCIITRGYGGSEKGPYLVQVSDLSARVGDEALLIAKSSDAPVVIARKRVAGAKYIEKQKLGDIIILDDGFQHRWLARSVDILSIDVSTKEKRQEFVDGVLLPVGYFREDRTKGLVRATTIVLAQRQLEARPQDPDPQIISLLPESTSNFRSYYSDVLVTPMHSATSLPTTNIIAVSGIANPEPFVTSLERKGFTVVKRCFFPDHHVFSESDITSIESQYPDCSIVCTEKDAVRIDRQMNGRWFYTKAIFAVYPEDAFISHILKRCSKTGR